MIPVNIFVTLLVFLKTATSQDLLNGIQLPAKHYKNDSISECLTKIFKKEIPSNSTVFVISSNNYHKSFLRSINEYYQFSVITRSFDGQQWVVSPDVYLISVKTKFEFLSGINNISTDSLWKPTAKFIIIWKNLRDNEGEILELFNMLLRKSIINVVIIKISKNNDFELLTYYPYSGYNCGKNANDIRSLGSCRNFSDTPLFPDKVPNGLRNCTIHVAARLVTPYVIMENSSHSKYLDIGVEQYLLNIIAKHEGFKFEIKYIDPKEGIGAILPNQTVTGLLGYLHNGEASVVLGGLFLLKKRIEVFDFVYGYNYALFSIITPVIKEQKWTRAYRQFSFTTWVLIVISFVFATIIILKTLSITSGKPKDKLMIILKLWQYFYGQVDQNLFKNKYLKRIMIVWILYTNSICAFYNTALYSLITGHVQNQIRINPSDLASIPLTPCIKEQTRAFFKFSYNQTFPKGDTSPQCQNSNSMFEGVASRTDLYVIDTDYNYFSIGSKYEDAEGRPKLKKWDFPRNLVLVIYTTKGFPLKDSFQKHALHFYERGLLNGHLAKIFAKKPKEVSALDKKYTPIQLEDFIIHFSILFIGAVISFISFTIELKTGARKID